MRLTALVAATLLAPGCIAPALLDAGPAPAAAGGPVCVHAPCGHAVSPEGADVREPFVAVSPTDPRHVVLAVPSASGGPRWIAHASSLDGGGSWTWGEVPRTAVNAEPALPPYNAGTDVGVAFADDGSIVLTALAWRVQGGVALTSPDLLAWRSEDGGRTFGPGFVVDRALGPAPGLVLPSAQALADKGYLAVDRGTGRLLLAWTRVVRAGPDGGGIDAPTGALDPYVATSDDDGRTWSPPARVLRAAQARPIIYIGLTVAALDDVALLGARGPGNQYHIFRSEDGGVSWSSPVPVAQHPPGDLQQPALALWRAGDDLHAALAVPDGGGAGVNLHRSPDGGRTWESPLQVAPEGRSTKRLPVLAAEPRTDRAVLSFYDDARVLLLGLADGAPRGFPAPLGPAAPTQRRSEYMGLAWGTGAGFAAWEAWTGSAVRIDGAALAWSWEPHEPPSNP